jgi:hypothetical protein
VSSVSLPLSGRKETPRTSSEIEPWLYRLSRKVGTVLALETVSSVRMTGPKPMIPSTPLKPDDEVAAPIDCDETVRPPKLTVSVYSLPENEPLP